MRSVRAICLGLILVASMAPLQGLIVFDGKNTTNNQFNVITPGNPATYPSGTASGVPWQHLIQYGNGGTSAVYIGNGYLLTARHVGTQNTGLLINGLNYTRDTAFAPVFFTISTPSGNEVYDLQLQKINGNPGLPVVAIAGSTTPDLNRASVMLGWGLGKGSIITNEGWNWGDNATKALRWGTNMTQGTTTSISYLHAGISYGPFDSLVTNFSSNAGATEAQAANGDSGGPLFQSISNVWTLGGIAVTVSQHDLSRYSAGQFQGDRTFYVRIKDVAWAMRYVHWKEKYGIATSTPDTDDLDGDGIPLLIEYALGLDPVESNRSGLPQVAIESTNLTLTFSRLATTTDIKVEVEISETLNGDWTVVPATFTTLNSTSILQTVKASVPLGSGNHRFARLKVTRL